MLSKYLSTCILSHKFTKMLQFPAVVPEVEQLSFSEVLQMCDTDKQKHLWLGPDGFYYTLWEPL